MFAFRDENRKKNGIGIANGVHNQSVMKSIPFWMKPKIKQKKGANAMHIITNGFRVRRNVCTQAINIIFLLHIFWFILDSIVVSGCIYIQKCVWKGAWPIILHVWCSTWNRAKDNRGLLYTTITTTIVKWSENININTHKAYCQFMSILILELHLYLHHIKLQQIGNSRKSSFASLIYF